MTAMVFGIKITQDIMLAAFAGGAAALGGTEVLDSFVKRFVPGLSSNMALAIGVGTSVLLGSIAIQLYTNEKNKQ